MKYIAPEFKKNAFSCPMCKAYSKFDWDALLILDGTPNHSGSYRAVCQHCSKPTYWVSANHKNGVLVYPRSVSAPHPHEDMPEELKADYNEARNIFADSPRGSAALLRLIVQKLCVVLGLPGKNINDDIGQLVKTGLPIKIQQALDVVRVTGNNAVHPGKMDVAEDSQDVIVLFDLVNMMVESQISQPKKVAELYSKLPDGAREAIEKRDG